MGLPTVVSYPGVMPAATEVARGLLEAGMLARYETTFVHEGERGVGAVLERALGGRLAGQLRRRSLPGIPAARVRRQPTWELVRTGARMLGAGEVVSDRIWERTMHSFDRGVAAGLSTRDWAIYGYEHACRASFERAQELGVHTIFDLASPHYRFMEALLARELEATPEAETDHYRATQRLAQERNAHKQAELDAAELVVANSAFTARTLTDTGYPGERVRVVPLGAPEVDGSWRDLRQDAGSFLFAGVVSVRKGAPHLLAAWERLGAGGGARLVLAGQWTLSAAQRAELPPSIETLGSIPRADLFERYKRASVLVFPSVCDGFGMVVTEALAHGLPVITTRNVGAADLIEEGVNGWVVEPGDPEALAARMQWCLDNPAALREMREAAEATAAGNGWSDYRLRVVAAIREHFGVEPERG